MCRSKSLFLFPVQDFISSSPLIAPVCNGSRCDSAIVAHLRGGLGRIPGGQRECSDCRSSLPLERIQETRSSCCKCPGYFCVSEAYVVSTKLTQRNGDAPLLDLEGMCVWTRAITRSPVAIHVKISSTYLPILCAQAATLRSTNTKNIQN